MCDQNNISIEAHPFYIAEQSSPADNRYVFAYTMVITNHGTLSAQLLSRHWLITDANGHIQEVSGDGVVGEQPHIKPGESFRYTSGTVLETPVAVMQGRYTMRSGDGEHFNALIPQFTLSIPRTLH